MKASETPWRRLQGGSGYFYTAVNSAGPKSDPRQRQLSRSDGEVREDGWRWEEQSWAGKYGDAPTNTWGGNAISSVNHLMTDSRGGGGGGKVEPAKMRREGEAQGRGREQMSEDVINRDV